MAWLSNNSWATSAAMTAAALNNLANDIRAWGGDVNGGGYALSNVALRPNAGTAGAPAISAGGDTDTGWFFPAANVLAAATGGAERIRIDPAGNVGFGASPSVAFDVVRSGSDVQIRLATGTVDLRVWAYHTGAGIFGTNSAHDLIFGVGGLVERMRITTSGRCGLGTNGPGAQLHVVGQVANEVLRLQGLTDASNNRTFVSLFSTNPAYWWEFSQQDASGGGTSNGLAFRERSVSGVSVERVFVAPGGNVGINKMTPNSKLAVGGLPTHADNTAAVAGGLTAGDFYRTSAGVLMVAF